MIRRNKFKPSNMDSLLASKRYNKRGLLSKITFDDTDDDELELYQQTESNRQNNLKQNKNKILRLSKKIIQKCNSLEIHVEPFNRYTSFFYYFDKNNIDGSNIDITDYNLLQLEKYIKKKTGYDCTITTHHIVIVLEFPKHMNNRENQMLFDIETLSKADIDYFDSDVLKKYENAYDEDNELLDDIDEIMSFIIDNIDISDATNY